MAMAGHQDELGEHLDELVLMVLDNGLHDDTGVTSMLGDQLYFHNLIPKADVLCIFQ